jgi:TM2 domain-containing membrane protein YozV
MECINCRTKIPVDVEFCGNCGYDLRATRRTTQSLNTPKNPTFAVLLSLFLPAIGQIYNGDVKKALAMWAGYVVGLIASAVGIGWIIIFGIWIWSMVDAYNVATGKGKRW